jgi:hypothetical protein
VSEGLAAELFSARGAACDDQHSKFMSMDLVRCAATSILPAMAMAVERRLAKRAEIDWLVGAWGFS